jgi:hypothetical protein
MPLVAIPPSELPSTGASSAVVVGSPDGTQAVSEGTVVRSVYLKFAALAVEIENDPFVEDVPDYTPVPSADLAAPAFPDEEWPEGSGPLGF